MKKILAVALALTMIVGMSIPAFAAYEGENTVIPLTAGYDKATAVLDTSVIVYDVNVTYDAMTFNFTETANKTIWNPAELDYTGTQTVTGGTWENNKTTANITVTNKSNAALTISATISGETGFTVTGDTTCASAVGAGEEGANAPTTATLVVTAPATIADDVTANVTVAID